MQIVLANLLIVGLNFGTGIITARLLGPGGRGELTAMIFCTQFLAYSFSLGLPSALLYNLKRYPEQASRLFSVVLLEGLLMGGAATAVGILVLPSWLNGYSLETVRYAQWAMLIAPLMLLNYTFTFALQARGEFSLYNAVRYLNPLLTLFALAALAWVHHLTPFTSALAYVLPTVPIFLWMVSRLWALYRPKWRGLGPTFKRLNSYGLRSYGVDLVTQLSLQLDKVLVVGLLSPAAMGLYVVASSLALVLNVFQAAVVSVLFPKASGLGVEEVVSLTERAAKGSIALTALAAVGLALFSPWVLGLLYGQEYLDAIPIFRLLLFAIVLNGSDQVLAQAFMALDRPGVVTVMQGIGIGLSVPLLLALVPRYGLEGAGLALLLSASVRFVSVLASFPLILKVRLPRLWLTRTDLAPVTAIFSKGEKH